MSKLSLVISIILFRLLKQLKPTTRALIWSSQIYTLLKLIATHINVLRTPIIHWKQFSIKFFDLSNYQIKKKHNCEFRRSTFFSFDNWKDGRIINRKWLSNELSRLIFMEGQHTQKYNRLLFQSNLSNQKQAYNSKIWIRTFNFTETAGPKKRFASLLLKW